MKKIIQPDRSLWPSLVKRPTFSLNKIREIVTPIINDVKSEGDSALSRYCKQFDNIELSSFKLNTEEIKRSASHINEDLKIAIAQAKTNIELFHSAQKENFPEIETMPGVKCWRRSVGIEKVGLYIPGGTAPLFSTLLMLAVPAKLASCEQIIICTPSLKEDAALKAYGERILLDPTLAYCAQYLELKDIFVVGGAQAIAAMAYGTQSIPKVDKIFGPGNQYVTAAKQIVNQDGIAIDMPAGPSELLVIADQSAEPAFVAADLLSQAEHGSDSQVVLIATDLDILERILEQTAIQCENLERANIAKAALTNSLAIYLESVEQALELSNLYAPEHLILAVLDPRFAAEQVKNAGSVFLGNYSPESAGDYASGTNHTLPTDGHARSYSGVSLDSFVKKITFQELSKEGLKALAPTVQKMAQAEGLSAHAQAVSIRICE